MRVPLPLWERFAALAAAERRSYNELFTLLIEEGVAAHETVRREWDACRS